MTGARFDILFAGALLADASREGVRRRLQQRFQLSGAVAARLFDGRTHWIKRNVDTTAASRYREIFRDAGALIEIRPVAASSEIPPPTAFDERSAALASVERDEPARSTSSRPPPQDPPRDSAPPSLRPVHDLSELDTSHLSLVSGSDWTLEDCQPPLPPAKLPDTRHLALVMPTPSDGEEHEG